MNEMKVKTFYMVQLWLTVGLPMVMIVKTDGLAVKWQSFYGKTEILPHLGRPVITDAGFQYKS